MVYDKLSRVVRNSPLEKYELLISDFTQLWPKPWLDQSHGRDRLRLVVTPIESRKQGSHLNFWKPLLLWLDVEVHSRCRGNTGDWTGCGGRMK